MNIGTIQSNAQGHLSGSLATVMVAMNFALREVEARNEKAPRFEILTRNTGGVFVQVGALWEKASLESGECYLQGRIDDPSLTRPLPITAFKQKDGSYNVVWSRPRARQRVDAFAPAGQA
ncbi:MAG: DUF736 domain-containing protein [Pseudomonadota bacterium]